MSGNQFDMGYRMPMWYEQRQSVPLYQPQSYQPQIISNKLLVTGLEDALARNVPPNSEFVYFHQDKDLLYVVNTDATGKKTHLTLAITKHEEQPPVEYVPKADFEALAKQVEELVKRGATNAEPNK
ncbi:MAG: hypothetical protein IKB98_09050 [Clostridia bacterium]|nr:hypothetical protein [Clostridia bacterium]